MTPSRMQPKIMGSTSHATLPNEEGASAGDVGSIYRYISGFLHPIPQIIEPTTEASGRQL